MWPACVRAIRGCTILVRLYELVLFQSGRYSKSIPTHTGRRGERDRQAARERELKAGRQAGSSAHELLSFSS
jgi:hypothetical protein